MPPPRRRPILRRTTDPWGDKKQGDLARIRVGVVGVGRVGCMVAEMLARIGLERILLVDPDRVEIHNLDRLLYAGKDNVGQRKTALVSQYIKKSATAEKLSVSTSKYPIQNEQTLSDALDCDILFSDVDRPLPKDLLNRIAYVHRIPVVSGGVFIDTKPDGTMGQATWSVSSVGPERRCLRCEGRYTASQVAMETDGTLDDSLCIHGQASTSDGPSNQNVFPFSVNVASFMVIQIVRMVVSASWWPDMGGTMQYSMIPNRLQTEQSKCESTCSISEDTAVGDEYRYPLIVLTVLESPPSRWGRHVKYVWNRVVQTTNTIWRRQ